MILPYIPSTYLSENLESVPVDNLSPASLTSHITSGNQKCGLFSDIGGFFVFGFLDYTYK